MKLSFSDQQDGLDLNWRRNRWQALAALTSAASCATYGAWIAPEARGLAAAVGGVLGLPIGTFLSGLAIMCWPVPDVPVETVRSNLDRLHQRLKKLFLFWIAAVILALVSAALS